DSVNELSDFSSAESDTRCSADLPELEKLWKVFPSSGRLTDTCLDTEPSIQCPAVLVSTGAPSGFRDRRARSMSRHPFACPSHSTSACSERAGLRVRIRACGRRG